jgi:hypothetical protein
VSRIRCRLGAQLRHVWYNCDRERDVLQQHSSRKHLSQKPARRAKFVPKVPQDEVEEEILSQIAESPGGASIGALSRSLSGGVSRRSLQRRLAQLVAAGKLQYIKRGRSTRYLLPPPRADKSAQAAILALTCGKPCTGHFLSEFPRVTTASSLRAISPTRAAT